MADAHELAHAPDPLQVRHQHVRRAQLEHAAEAVAGVLGFAAGDRGVERRRDAGEALEVPGRQRLLEPGQVEFLELPAEADCLGLVQALVGICHQLDLRPDRLAHRAHARNVGDVARRAEPHLHGLESGGNEALRLGDELVDRI
jgi:hypothetical protein